MRQLRGFPINPLKKTAMKQSDSKKVGNEERTDLVDGSSSESEEKKDNDDISVFKDTVDVSAKKTISTYGSPSMDSVW